MDLSSPLAAALRDKIENNLSFRQAAKKWDVKPSTLCDRASGKVKMGACKGPPKILTTAEENMLAEWIIGMRERGFHVTKKQLLQTVKEILDKDKRETPLKRKTPPNLPGEKWYRQFCKRNPKAKLFTPRKRAKVSKEEVEVEEEDEVDMWFREFEMFLSDQNLLNKPHNIWHCDKSRFAMHIENGKTNDDDNEEHMTVFVAVSAAGAAVPPYYVFPQKQAPPSWKPLAGSIDNGPPCYLNERGEIDSKMFYTWFTTHFIPSIPDFRPVALLYDGYDTRDGLLDLFQVAIDNDIKLFKMLPNASHCLPCVVSLFPPLRSVWTRAVNEYTENTPTKETTTRNMIEMFVDAWMQSVNPRIISEGFSKSGIFPVNKSKMLMPSLQVESSST